VPIVKEKVSSTLDPKRNDPHHKKFVSFEGYLDENVLQTE